MSYDFSCRTKFALNDTVSSYLTNNSSEQEFLCVWLDPLCTNHDRPLYQLLHRSCNQLELFSDVCECISYIVDKTESEKLIIVVSYSLAEHFIPLIRERDEIIFIYIDCISQEPSRELWINKTYSKTTNRIFTAIGNFQRQFESDIAFLTLSNNTWVNHDLHGPLPCIKSFSSDDNNSIIQNLSKNGLAFIRFQLIIEILLRMNTDQQAKKVMVEECRRYYRSNIEEQKIITEFENKFRAQDAIWWYTRPCFVFHLLNRALGSQNVDYMFAFRYITKEIHQQLSELFHGQSRPLSMTVYRGKIIPLSIVRMMYDAVGGLISMNGFLLTNEQREISQIYCGQDNSILSNYARVLFTMDVGNNIATKPYAYIRNYSAIPDEDEVLFSVGTVWRVISVNEDVQSGVWNIKLKLSIEDNSRCIELRDYLEKQLGSTASFATLGNFLYELGEYQHAEGFYQLALDQFNDLTNLDRCLLLNNIGCIRVTTGDELVASEYFEKALNHLKYVTDDRQQNSLYNMVSRGNLSVCSTLRDISIADMDPFQLRWLLDDNFSNGKVLNNMGVIYFKKGDHNKALSYYKSALKNLKETYESCPPDFLIVYNNLANLFYEMNLLDDALENFQLAINSGLELWSPQHPWITTCVDCKAMILQQISPQTKLRRNGFIS